GRPAVDDDVPEVVIVLRQDRFDGAADRVGVVQNGRDERDARELERPGAGVVLAADGPMHQELAERPSYGPRPRLQLAHARVESFDGGPEAGDLVVAIRFGAGRGSV